MAALCEQDMFETTLMFRNIPRRFQVQDILMDLELLGLSRTLFDFVYVPWHRASTTNMGYAFLNFTEPAFLVEGLGLFAGRFWSLRHGERKPIRTVRATVQGLEENLKQFLINNPDPTGAGHGPCILVDGVEVDIVPYLDRVAHAHPCHDFDAGEAKQMHRQHMQRHSRAKAPAHAAPQPPRLVRHMPPVVAAPRRGAGFQLSDHSHEGCQDQHGSQTIGVRHDGDDLDSVSTTDESLGRLAVLSGEARVLWTFQF